MSRYPTQNVTSTGDVLGPASSTDNAIARYDGTSGNAIQDSGVTIDDSNNVSGVAAAAVTTIELGHASDTTLARSGAGSVTIEGNVIYRAGGTDVALADGGTGASLADPGADRFLFWDDSETAVAWLTPGNGFTITTTTVAIDSASDAVDGIVELATAAETTTGTDATRAVTPDGLAGSDYGKTVVSILVYDDSQDVSVADGAGDVFWRVPAVLNGYNLVAVAAAVQTAGTTGTTDVQIHNVTQAADMLTTKITIDSGETDSSTAATAAVIDTGNDDVATGDRIRIDVDATSTTEAKGLLVELTFQLP